MDLKSLEVLIKNLSTSAGAMVAISDMRPEGEADIRDDVVNKIVTRVSEIVRGASTLGPSTNATAIAILARQILESLITLMWTISDKCNVQKYNDACENEFQRIAKLNMESGLLKIYSREDNSDQTESFAKEKFTEKFPRAVSTEQQAREAGILDLYTIFYRFMSLDVHGKSETVTDGCERLSDTIVHLQGIGALSMAVGHSATLWKLHRTKVDNETLRELMGFNSQETS